MKKNIALAALVGLAISGAANAQSTRPAMAGERGLYVGGSFGQSKIKLDGGDFSAAAYGATSDSRDESDSAYKLFVGYKFNRIWAIEGGYADLGKARYSVAVPGGSGAADLENQSWFLSGKGTWAVTNQIGVFGKLGAARNESEVSFTDSPAGVTGGAFTGRHTRTSMTWGLGAEYAFSRNIGVRLEYEDFGKFGNQNDTGRSKTNLWSLGLTYSF